MKKTKSILRLDIKAIEEEIAPSRTKLTMSCEIEGSMNTFAHCLSELMEKNEGVAQAIAHAVGDYLTDDNHDDFFHMIKDAISEHEDENEEKLKN
jgi:hypothetical protein